MNKYNKQQDRESSDGGISLDTLDKRLKDIDRTSSARMKKIRDYEPYVIPVLALLIIIGGFVSAGLLDNSNTPIGFVVVDLTGIELPQQTYYKGELACRDEWLCSEWSGCSSKGIETRECLNFGDCMFSANAVSIEQERSCIIKESIHDSNKITGMAAFGDEGTTRLLRLLIFIMVIASLAVMVTYIILAYAMAMASHHHWAAVSYWIAMAGIPLSVYYTVTSKENIVSAYVSFILVILAFAVLMVLKPWKPMGLAELGSINHLIEQRSIRAKRNTGFIRDSRRRRLDSESKFIQKLKEADSMRQLEVEGVKDLKLSKIDREIKSLLEKGDETRRSAEYIKSAIKDRESRFNRMNSQLKKWAEQRRMEREEIEAQKKDEALAKKRMLEAERKRMKEIVEAEDKRELEEANEETNSENQSQDKKRGVGEQENKGGNQK